MSVYIKVSGTLIHVPLLIWQDYSMEELQSMGDGCIPHKHDRRSSCTFLATAKEARINAWYPQLHDCHNSQHKVTLSTLISI